MCGKNCGKLQEKPNKLQNKHLEINSSLFPFTRSHFPFSSSSDYLGLEKPFHLCELSEPPLFGWHLSLSNQAGLADSSCWPEEGLCCRLHRSDCCRMSKKKDYLKLQTSLSLSSRAGNIRIALLSLATTISLFFPLSLSLSAQELSSLAVPLGQTLNSAKA